MPTAQSAYLLSEWETAFGHATVTGNPHNTQISDIPNLSSTLASLETWTLDDINNILYNTDPLANLNISEGNVFIDTVNNRVGINKPWPSNPVEFGYVGTETSIVYGSGGSAFASSNYAAEIAAKAFDNNLSEGWMTDKTINPAPQNVGWIFPTPRMVTKYSVYSPLFTVTDWTFEGWDGSQWVVLDTRTNQLPITESFYTFSNTVSYTRYRLNISNGNNAQYFGVRELRMFENTSFTTGVVLDASGNFGVNKLSGLQAKFHLKGSGTDNTTNAFKIDNNSDLPLFSVKNGNKAIFNLGYNDSARGTLEISNNGGANPDVKIECMSNANFRINGATLITYSSNNTMATANGALHFTGTNSAGGGDLSGVYLDLTNKELNFGRVAAQNSGWRIRNYSGVGDNPTGFLSIEGQKASTAATSVGSVFGGKLVLRGGDGTVGSSINAYGGNVEIYGGTGYGTGVKGDVIIQGLKYPKTDGTNGQVITTDGSGNLTFSSAVGGVSKYTQAITGTSGTILGATHGKGTDLIVQVYEGNSQIYISIDVDDVTGDVSWSSTVSLVSGKIVIL